MLTNIKLWLSKFKMDRDPKIKTNFGCAMDFVNVEDSRVAESKKAVDAMFKEQAIRMEATRQIAHGPECENAATCRRSPCFIWEPNIYRAHTIEKRKSKKKRTQELIEWVNRDRGFRGKDDIDTHHKGMTADQLLKPKMQIVKRKPGRPKGSKNG
jgi:hypothetical protein